MAHGRVIAWSKSVLVDHHTGLDWPGVGHPLSSDRRHHPWVCVYFECGRRARTRHTDWYILLTDIDDRKRAESELTKAFGEIAKSEGELRIIIDAIPQLIVAIGTDGKFLNANQAVLEYTGLNERRHEVGKLS
jgi:PAS domain-containing protein